MSTRTLAEARWLGRPIRLRRAGRHATRAASLGAVRLVFASYNLKGGRGAVVPTWEVAPETAALRLNPARRRCLTNLTVAPTSVLRIPARLAPRSLWRALLTPQVNPYSTRYGSKPCF